MAEGAVPPPQPPALDPAMARLLEEPRPRVAGRLQPRERQIEAVVGLLFLAAAILVAVLADWDRSFPWGTAAVLIVAAALLERVEFDVGQGFVAPIQLVVVPMLFLLPLPAVPLVVALSHLIGRLPDYARRKAHPERVLVVLGDSWHCLGPVLVFLAAGVEEPDWSDWPVYLAALGSQFLLDLLSAMVRGWVGHRISPLLIARILGWVDIVDGLLSPIGLLAAFVATQDRFAFLLVLPLALLLQIFGTERRNRIAHALELSRAALERRRIEEELRTANASLAKCERDQRNAMEINDNVVQRLTVAGYAFDRGMNDYGRDLLGQTLEDARRIITDLLPGTEPGGMRREEAAAIGELEADEEHPLQAPATNGHGADPAPRED